MVPLTSPSVVLLFGCFVKGPFNTQRGVKNLIGQFGVLHPLHPQCGCSSVKMCEQRTWTVCCFLLGPKPVTLESITGRFPYSRSTLKKTKQGDPFGETHTHTHIASEQTKRPKDNQGEDVSPLGKSQDSSCYLAAT